MANSAKTSSKLAALIKKTAQKLVKNPKAIHKELKKLALTLPLMALLVEEVRAAQNKISIDAFAAPAEVFEDEAALAEFIDEQNLDEAQYAEVTQELEGVLLAQADQAKQEDDDDKGALLERSETGAGRGLAAEAESDAAATAAEHAAADTESFELAGLVIPIAPAPLIGAVAGGLGLVAVANVNNAPEVKTETATSDTLAKSLKQLVAEGVNFVQPVAGSDTLNIRFGTEGTLASTAGVPLVGDTNQDTSITTAENGALKVNLTIDSAEQLAELAALPGLVNFGFDSVSINLASQSLLDALVSDTTLAADLATIRATGLTINTIDMGASVSINEAQAATLVSSGIDLHFAAADDITLQAPAGSTHLNTSLKDLQKLGVDTVTVTVTGAAAGADLHVALGNGAAIDLANGALPSFGADSALNVTLHLDSAQTSGITGTGVASALVNANVDQVNINVANAGTDNNFQNEFVALFDNAALRNAVETFGAGHVNTQLDFGGAGVAGQLTLDTVEAQGLVDLGVSFALNDTIQVQSEAGSTHLSTSLKDLHKLGVDAVAVSGTDHISVDLGSLTAAEVAAGGAIANFTSTSPLDVTLNVQDTAQFDQATQMASGLTDAGIGNVEINVAADAQGFFGAALNTLNQDDAFRDNIATLVNSGLDVGFDFGGKDVVANLLFDELSAINLIDEGLHLAANDHIGLSIQASDPAGTHLANSLKDLQKLGVDAVAVSGSDHVVVDAGGLTAADIASGAVLTQFDADLDVTLSVADMAEFTATSAIASQLNTANIDNIEIVVPGATTQQSSSNFSDILAGQNFSEGLTTFTDAHLNVGFDFGGADSSLNVFFNAQSAASFVADGLHFASNDIIDMHVLAAQGTHLSTSLQDLQKLGVDNVLVEAGINSVSITLDQNQPLGNQTILVGDTNKDGVISDAEDAALDVTVNVQNIDDLSLITNLADTFALSGVDHLGLLSSDFNDATLVEFLEKMAQAGGKLDYSLKVDSLGSDGGITQDLINFGFDSNATPGSDWGDFIQTMQDTGMANIQFDNSADNRLGIDDELSAALYESGMLNALPSANMFLDAKINPVFGGDDLASSTHQALSTSLVAMAELGIDSVESATGVDKLFVSLGDNADVATIVAGFTNGSQAPDNGGLFAGKDAGLVIDEATFDQFTNPDIAELLSQLFSLGFTEIDVLKGENDSESYQITAQTQVLVPTDVQLLGVNDANALLDVFGTDILDKKIS